MMRKAGLGQALERLACWAVCVALTAVPVSAQDVSAADDTVAQPGVAAAVREAAAKRGGEDGQRFAKIEDVTKDMKAEEGLFTLFRHDPGDKQKDPEKLLAKIPAKLLGDDMLFAMSISRGPMAGFMWGDALIRFQVVGDQLKIVTPDTRFTRQDDAPVDDAISRTYNDSYMAAVPILAMSPQGDVVIDLSKLLKSDVAGVSRFGGRVNSGLSTWQKVKAFPDNVLIEANLALSQGEGGSSVGVAYSFRRLPKLGSYKPRVADPRVGYFLTAQLDWTKKPNERETFDRYIHRWRLEKRDPSLTLSPPKEPIVFIIEKTVPIQWRRWVREGIEEWNQAYEKIGFTDAIIVQQQTDSNEFASHDPEDARYNFFRWGVSGRAFAMGPSRVDPRTGEILDADILFDDAFVRAWLYRFDLFGPSATAVSKGPGFETWLSEHPHLVPPYLQEQIAREAHDPQTQLWRALEEELEEHGRCTCSYAAGKQQQLGLLQYALIATGSSPKEIPEQLIGEAIKEIVTHEVGHTLGLRHNFKASSWLSLEEIVQRRNSGDEPTAASVMDYTPLLFFADDKIDTVRHFITPTIGPYDEWAIEYGYSVPQGKKEAEHLKTVLSRCTEPALAYATDEDTVWVYSPDPYSNRYDLSSDPVAYAKARIELTDRLLDNIEEWAVQEGEPYYYLTRAYDAIWSERIRNLDYVARMVGGQIFNRYQKGDADAPPPFVLVEPEKQRAALKYLGETMLSDGFFRLDADLMNKLAPSRWSHWGLNNSTRLDFGVHERIRAMQIMSLLHVTAPQVLQRIYDAELKTGADDKFTVAELLKTLRQQVWTELDQRSGGASDSKPAISSLRRNLQRAHLFILLSTAQAQPGLTMSEDIQAMVRLALKELSEDMSGALKDRKLDFASRAHLTECQSRIERVLEAEYEAR